MANSKSYIREINLQNTSINLNKNKSIVSDFTGFNKNTGVWFNNVLSNLYNVDDKADGNIITINNDTFKITDGALYKNGVLVKDYSNSNKVKTEILGNIADNVLAYTPEVDVYYEGSNAYVRYSDTIVSVGSYYPSTIPYIVIDKEADTWCVMYGKYVVCKGMHYSMGLSDTPTAAIYSPDDNKWYCIINNGAGMISPQDNGVIDLGMTADIIIGAATVSGWTPKNVSVVQINSRKAFACITDLKVSSTPTVVLNEDIKTFQYLKGYVIQGTTATPHYSNEGDAIDVSVIADNFTLYTQAFDSYNKLASLQTKFLSYSSYLAIPYSTVAVDRTSTLMVSTTSLDGPTSYLFESLYTTENNEFVTLAGSTAGQSPNAANMNISWSEVAPRVEDKNYPKLLGLFNSNFTPEWLHTDVEGFKLIYNRDALAGISKDGNIVVPWNDVDENSCTIYGDDIYYYSLNSNAWVHINVGTENDLKALKVGNYLILNSLTDNGYREDSLFTYNIDTSLANFTIPKPRVGLINVYGVLFTSYIVPGDASLYSLGNNWLTYMLNYLKNSAKTYYLSISRDELGPIWAATELINYSNVNTRKEGWQHTLTPSIESETIDYSYYLNNMLFESASTIDAYASSSGSVLTYFKSWYDGIAKYNNKLTDTEKSMTEPTYYNLSPSIDIMTFIDGFNTIALVKVGNNTLQLLVKESELLLVYNLLSNVNNISDYFVLQGQQYGIINDYINKIEMVNGQVVAQTPITSVAGLKFLGNTDRQAFFFSQMNKTILYFAADNTLEFLMDATELDNNTTTVFAKQTNDIFLLLNDKVVVFTNSGSMFEMLSRAEYITFGDNSWSDGNRTWSYYKTSDEQERVPIQLETLWYGDTTTRRLMNVDCVYIELYDDNYMPGKFEISIDSLMNNTVSTKKQVFNVKEKDYDRATKTVYLRYQPAFQNCAAFKLNIKSELPIKRLAVGYTQEGIPLISKNNI